MSLWYADLPKISNRAINKKNEQYEIQERLKAISQEKRDLHAKNKKLKEIKRTEKFVKIVIRKLNSKNSLLSQYIKLRAEQGVNSTYVKPYIVMTIFTYMKYWKSASKNIDLANSLFAQYLINKNLLVYLSSYHTNLIVSW